MKVRVGTVAVFNTAGGTGRDVIEACGDDIAGHDPFAPASSARERVLFQLHERATDRVAVRLDKAVIVSDQRLEC